MTLEQVAKTICDNESLLFEGFVGSGAFKDTFHVRSSIESIALKVYKPDNRNEREQDEINAMKRCNHPNIAKFYHINELVYSGTTYLYSQEEFISGGTLAKRINQSPLTKDQLLQLGDHLIQALSHIAGLKLIHRDLKPDNIMFRDDGITPIIVDFGIVKDLESTSKTETFAMRGPGSPYYASPEQLNNEKRLQDWRADQFCLGVLLAISIFKDHPYDDGNGEVVHRVSQRYSPSANFIQRVESAGLTTLIKMVDPWAINRYNTPELLYEAWKQQG